MRFRYIACLAAIIFATCAFADDTVLGSQSVRVGVIFGSNTFEISDNLAVAVCEIIGSSISAASAIDLVERAELERAAAELGFTKQQLSETVKASEIGIIADVPFMIISGIDYDFKKAAKAKTPRGIGRIFGIGKSSKAKAVNPTFELKVIEAATGAIILEDKADIDALTQEAKQQLTGKELTEGSMLEVDMLDTSAIYAAITPIVPDIQNVITARAERAEPDQQKIIMPLTPVIPTPATISEPAIPEPTPEPEPNLPQQAERMLVRQPVYEDMSFYVFKPEDIQGEYYVTYDGYYVYSDNDGVWHYATCNDDGTISKTGYLVGSVIPANMNLKPYDGAIPLPKVQDMND